ncbi:hypothetical protein EWM64_g6471 [Hericium alpestre]|uniref:Uncharacterized protein n=1 Tax=Hericium alpestre TaxID=135208 RepID=A0A4Y9ZTL5_9AGAM|nr:hypothetical protein EWM64_g6471 [Hericium alpestre]
MGQKNSTEKQCPASTAHSYPPQPLAPRFPVELVHKIILLYLADVFWDLIAKPGLDCTWDPLSPLLHASFQFRELTTSFLIPIAGKSTIQYRPLLASLKRFKRTAERHEPKGLLSPYESRLLDPVRPLEHQKSPILWLGYEFSMKRLHRRLYEYGSESGIASEGSGGLMRTHTILVAMGRESARDVAPSISATILRPLQERAMALHFLLQRIFLIQTLCDYILEYMPFLLRFTDDMIARGLPGLEEHHAKMEEVASDADTMIGKAEKMGYTVERLPIPDAALEAVHFSRALEALVPPPDRPESSSLVALYRRDRELLLATAGRAADQAVGPIAEEVREPQG